MGAEAPPLFCLTSLWRQCQQLISQSLRELLLFCLFMSWLFCFALPIFIMGAKQLVIQTNENWTEVNLNVLLLRTESPRRNGPIDAEFGSDVANTFFDKVPISKFRSFHYFKRNVSVTCRDGAQREPVAVQLN